MQVLSGKRDQRGFNVTITYFVLVRWLFAFVLVWTVYTDECFAFSSDTSVIF